MTSIASITALFRARNHLTPPAGSTRGPQPPAQVPNHNVLCDRRLDRARERRVMNRARAEFGTCATPRPPAPPTRLKQSVIASHAELKLAGEFLDTLGMNVVVDPSMPPDQLDFRDKGGKLLGRIVNIGDSDLSDRLENNPDEIEQIERVERWLNQAD